MFPVSIELAQQLEPQTMQVAVISLIVSLFVWVMHSVWPSVRAFPTIALGTWGLSFVGIIASLVFRSQLAGYFALSNMYESLLVLSLFLMLALVVAYRWVRLPMLGWPVALLVLAMVAFANTLPTDINPLQAALQSYWRAIHVPIIIASYALFALSFVSAVLHLVLSRGAGALASAGDALTPAMPDGLSAMTDSNHLQAQLHPMMPSEGHSTVTTTTVFSPAEMMAEVTYRAVAVGFPLLAIGIILGGLWANEAWGNYWSWDPKESMSLATLLAYGVYLHLRVSGQVSARTLSWVAVGGFAMMLVTYFGVNIMGLGLHSYGKIG